MAEAAITPLTVLRWLVGPLVWAAHFFVVYASESLFCTRGGGPTAHFMLVAAATAMSLAALLAILIRRRHYQEATNDTGGFMGAVAMPLAAIGMLGILWSALPALLMSSCVAPA